MRLDHNITGGATLTIALSPALEAWLTARTSDTNAALARIEAALVAAFKQETQHMAAIDDAIQQLTDRVTAQTTVIGSVKVFLVGVPKLISDAVAKAIAAGATPGEVQAITDLGNSLKQNTDDLAAALIAGTPADQPA